MGDIAGIVGAVIGVVALLVSLKSYVLAKEVKALDLRLELGKTFNNLDVVMSGIDGYLDFVHESHVRVLAATGRNNSGEHRLFDEEFARDSTRLRGLLATQPRRADNYQGHSQRELEALLVAVDAFHAQIAEIRRKYQAIFDADEERRREIRARHERST